MVLSYSAKESASSNALSRDAWIAKLSEGKSSTQQLQVAMMKSTTEKIEEIREEVVEKMQTSAKDNADSSDENYSQEYVAVKDDIVSPSEVTSEDLESPIDIKL